MWVTQNGICQMGKHSIEYINCKSKKEHINLKTQKIHCNNTKKKFEVICRKVPPKKTNKCSSIIGRLLNNHGLPIKNICIKLFNIDKSIVSCVLSDDHGYFYFNKIPLYEKFKIYAIDEFENKSNIEEFILLDEWPKPIDLIMNINHTCCNSIIVGDVFNCKNFNPIENITLSLFKQNFNGNLELDYIVCTNQYGQFAFRDICEGEYFIKTSGLGYKPKVYKVCINQQSQIVNLQIYLCEDEKKQNGTVSGVITDKNNKAVDYGDVILYKVDNNNGYEKLIPIAFTKTNQKGVYLFINVPKGIYKIKATKTRDF